MNNFLKLVIGSLITILFYNCSTNNNLSDNKSIIGTWKLKEVIKSDGSIGWQPVDNGYEYTFFKNGNFTSSRFVECDMGTYFIESNKLTLKFSCDGVNENVFVENIHFESGFLITTSNNIGCFYCQNKFEKTN